MKLIWGLQSWTLRGVDNFPLWKIVHYLYRAEKYETTCILHETFSSILENYLVIVRPYLQCKSPYFHRLWYFYLSATIFQLQNEHALELRRRKTQRAGSHRVPSSLVLDPTSFSMDLMQYLVDDKTLSPFLPCREVMWIFHPFGFRWSLKPSKIYIIEGN